MLTKHNEFYLSNEKIILNVGGSKFEILRKTLSTTHANGRIGKLVNSTKEEEIKKKLDI